jgi:hypothetical protein|nr:MAG TPA: hypothetical protein [Caudoviricetes sp.]
MQLIQIISRNCSDKVQPTIVAGRNYYATEEEPLKDGTKVLLIRHTAKDKPHRINAKRFTWKEVKIPIAIPKEIKAEPTILEKKEKITNNVDKEKLPHLVVSPFIINQIIINYTQKALEIASKERITALKDLSRKMRELIKRFEELHETALDKGHINYIQERTKALQEERARDFTIFDYTINSLIKKYNPTFKYIELSTQVLLAMLFVRVSDKHLNETSELIDKQTGLFLNNTRPPILDALYTCLDAMAGNIEIEKIINNELFERCVNTAHNIIKSIEYTVDDKCIA